MFHGIGGLPKRKITKLREKCAREIGEEIVGLTEARAAREALRQTQKLKEQREKEAIEKVTDACAHDSKPPGEHAPSEEDEHDIGDTKSAGEGLPTNIALNGAGDRFAAPAGPNREGSEHADPNVAGSSARRKVRHPVTRRNKHGGRERRASRSRNEIEMVSCGAEEGEGGDESSVAESIVAGMSVGW